MASYRLIAVDLDSTLLRSDHTLCPAGAAALAEAARQGVYVVLATTRNIYSARAFAREMGLYHPIICSNGAEVWSSPDGPIWKSRPLAPDIARAIVDLADARDWRLMITVGEMTYLRQRPGETLGQRDANHTIVATNTEALATGNPIRMLTYDVVAITGIRELLVRKFAGRYHWEMYYYADGRTKSAGAYAPGSDKGTGLALLCQHLDISCENVMVIGDNANDLPMWPHAALRVAMGNSTAEVKAQADVLAPTNDAAGVAWAVRRFVFWMNEH